MKKYTGILIISILIIVSFILLMTHPWTCGLPLVGWRYDAELTTQFYQDEFGDTPMAGYIYQIWVKTDLFPNEGGFFVRLYGKGVTPYSWWWSLDRKGIYNEDADDIFRWGSGI